MKKRRNELRIMPAGMLLHFCQFSVSESWRFQLHTSWIIGCLGNSFVPCLRLSLICLKYCMPYWIHRMVWNRICVSMSVCKCVKNSGYCACFSFLLQAFSTNLILQTHVSFFVLLPCHLYKMNLSKASLKHYSHKAIFLNSVCGGFHRIIEL